MIKYVEVLLNILIIVCIFVIIITDFNLFNYKKRCGMKRTIPKKMLVGVLLIMLLTSLGFLAGFTYPEYPINKDMVTYNDEGPEEQDEEDELEGEEAAEEDETGYWVCGECGYVYDTEEGDPEENIEPGTQFEDLPDNWVCPECGASKDEFKSEDEEKQEEEGRLAHLKHVLAMRLKHILVLQRVIEKLTSKNPLHPSIPALQHALQSSSKSIQKAMEAVGGYEENINNPDDGSNNDEDNNTDLENQNGKAKEKDITKGDNSKEKNDTGLDKKNENKNKENNGKGKENNGKGRNK